jgi:hypothetical protein
MTQFIVINIHSPCQLPDNVKDILSGLFRISKSGMASLHTHCRRELFHGCWEILLDEDFVHAYRHGIILKCADGVLRKVFPRIFTYSADYPEKYSLALIETVRLLMSYRVLIATIKDMGVCACPRCLTPKKLFSSLGLLNDMKIRVSKLRVYAMARVVQAREFIYDWGNTVDGTKIEHTLGEGSWVPTVVSIDSSSQFMAGLNSLLVESICRKAWTSRP